MDDGRQVDREYKQALDDLFIVDHEELGRIAASVPHSGPNVNVSTSTLIHEAWLKLVNSSRLELHSKLHFTYIAARQKATARKR